MAATPPFFPSALRRAALLALAALLAAILFNTCRPSPLPWHADWSHHIETLARRQHIPLLRLPDLRAALAADPPSVLAVDARTPEEYAAAHIPSAVSLPAASDEPAFAAFSLAHPLDTPLAVYCRDISCDDALVLAAALRSRGWTSVSLYSGGFAEWTAYDGPVDPPPPSPEAP